MISQGKTIELSPDLEVRPSKLSGYFEVIRDATKMVLFLAMLWAGYQGYLSTLDLYGVQKIELTDYLVSEVLKDRSFGLNKKGELITANSLDTIGEYKAALASTIRDNEDLISDLETVRLALASYDGKFNRGEIQIDTKK